MPDVGTEIGTDAHELIRQRLQKAARELAERANRLNDRRLETFGTSELELVGNERIRTENNCVPSDIASVEGGLLFGYNVFIGLRSETRVEDVFSFHRFAEGGDSSSLVPAEAPFLSDGDFVRDFRELYRYYSARLLRLRRTEGRLLAVFQVGQGISDTKVLRWSLDRRGHARYLDNRGERDHVFPPSHDFEWTLATREDHVSGRHPHVNVLDEVFVETVGGDLTIKIEDNTEDGLGIYQEPVDDPDQSLHDAGIRHARVGNLILLRIRPYREDAWRHFIFDVKTRAVRRADAIGQACVRLPEDHGVIFPGGLHLEGGETRTFDGEVRGLALERVVRSPNGEDVLHVFDEPGGGRRLLLPYNLIRKEVSNPISCHGHTLFDDGRLVMFRATSEEPTRVHAMQVWQTPFAVAEHAAAQAGSGSQVERIGNADLVRGISDALSVARLAERDDADARAYEDLTASVARMRDAYFWLADEECEDLESALDRVGEAALVALDEYQKVAELSRVAAEAVTEAAAELAELRRGLHPDRWTTVDPFITALDELRRQRGHLITLRDRRHVDRGRLAALEDEVVQLSDELSSQVSGFLQQPEALAPYEARLVGLGERGRTVAKGMEVTELLGELGATTSELDLLTEVVAGLPLDDPTVRASILEAISEVLAGVNRVRAEVEGRGRELQSGEMRAEFGARFALFGQSVTAALSRADTPERCEQELARLLLALEELEGAYGESDDFLDQLQSKREEVSEAIAARRQVLVDERQRRADRLVRAAERILAGLQGKASRLEDEDALNSFFASDPLVSKLRDQVARLRELGSSVAADEIEGRLKAARDSAGRSLRDRRDIYEDGGQVIRLGRHRFSVNAQPLELTLVPTDSDLHLHLAGTDFREPLEDARLARSRDCWEQALVSETPDMYRAEYLAAGLLVDAERGAGATIDELHAAVAEDRLLAVVRERASARYDEGHERGVHDHDAAAILSKLLDLSATAALLRFSPRSRALACLAWHLLRSRDDVRAHWRQHARSLARLRSTFGHVEPVQSFARELAERVGECLDDAGVAWSSGELERAGAYLFEEIARSDVRFVTSAAAVRLRDELVHALDERGTSRELFDALASLEREPGKALALARSWLEGHAGSVDGGARLAHVFDEAAVLLLTGDELDREISSALVEGDVAGLLGQHPRIHDRRMAVRLDELLERFDRFERESIPAFRAFQEARHEVLESERDRLRLDELEPKVMSGFVRNRLIDELYLPLIGDNLAKQLGAVGADRRTDQMGLLMLISPPGYGKTTLMEYVADRLGLIFVKVNAPALGHEVTSIDPGAAPNATARQELEKLNLALEMGNNVLLYVDDIQHSSSEFLQKFISLCDAQRKIEGVWRGRTRTHDLRGKKFAVCMAGNPYTESGSKFQVPDMLANRADVFNLGDVLTGREEVFGLSYLENALTSCPTLRPLASRDLGDFHALVRKAGGSALAADDLKHAYSAVELDEIDAVLRHLLSVRDVVLRVNAEYVRSASMDDSFRTEPRFQLQGSYRNMNKMAERILPAMNEVEVSEVIDGHYQQESQTLTTGAEQNLLKLAELRGRMTDEQVERWDDIKRTFQRLQVTSGDADDPVAIVSSQIALLGERLAAIDRSIGRAVQSPNRDGLTTLLEKLDSVLPAISEGSARALVPALERIGTALEQADAAAAGRGDESLKPVLERLESVLGALDRERETDRSADLVAALSDVAEKMGAAPAPTAEPDLLARIEEGFGALTEALKSGPVVAATGAGPSGTTSTGAEVLSPMLQRLEKIMQTLARAQQGAERGRRLTAAVHDLLARHVTELEESLLPSVHALGRRLGTTPDERALQDQLDRALRFFDLIKDLSNALHRGDGAVLASATRRRAEPRDGSAVE